MKRYTVMAGSSKLRHPFSCSIFEDTVYWTDWGGHAVRYTHKYPGGFVTDLYNSTSRLMDLHVVHPIKQPNGKYIIA